MTKKILITIVFAFILMISLASAGVGLKITQGDIKINEGQEGCITPEAYNPFPTGTNVQVVISDELKDVLTEYDSEIKYLPPETSSAEALPIKLCFKVPEVYQRSYLVGKVIDKVDCTNQPMKEYKGDIILESTPGGTDGAGAGGSATRMSVSQPLVVRVACLSSGWDFTFAYAFAAFLSAGIVGLVLYRRFRTPKDVRLKKKMAKLQAEMKGMKK
ncbi:MAG TPA: hypothetical protein VJH92_03700 [Candidatus Nanoarchaeia archaeon]|nr:hypothetical protein [Candidatus Nanoarchaeia archaeon]